MGRISEVKYIQVDPIDYDVHEAAQHYFHSNVIPIHEMFYVGYEEYELKQNSIRNNITRDNRDDSLKLNTSTFGISIKNNQVILVIDKA